jgi:hypothetical protein
MHARSSLAGSGQYSGNSITIEMQRAQDFFAYLVNPAYAF